MCVCNHKANLLSVKRNNKKRFLRFLAVCIVRMGRETKKHLHTIVKDGILSSVTSRDGSEKSG